MSSDKVDRSHDIDAAEDVKSRKSPLQVLLKSREFGILIAFAAMIVVLSLAAPEFLTGDNIVNNERNISFVGIAVLGEAFVLITGGIDLSVGSIWGMTGVASAALMAAGWPLWLSMLGALALAAAFGLFNGLCITKLRMPPFVPTLATMSIARAVALIVTRGRSIDEFRPGGDAFFQLGGGDILGVPTPFIVFVLLSIAAWVVFDRTVFGRRLFAIGGNEQAARLSGFDVDRMKLAVYIISALTAGLAGIIEVSYLSSAIANQGTGKELNVIAAAVIGGTNLTGGEGSILGVFIGTIILEVLRNGLVLLGTDAYSQGVFVGLVIVVAVFVDQVRKGLFKRK
jgi:ribose transport system permease protein